MNNSGVVAGTLVHTKEGLKPIETIQVGDYVLSKPESGEGDVAYKRVTQTFKHEDRELFGVVYGIKGVGYLISTKAEHPFWVPTLAVVDPNKKFGAMLVPHGQWVNAQDMYTRLATSYKLDDDFHKHYLTTFDGKEYPARATPICTATSNLDNNIHGYAGPEFGVIWPVDGKTYEGGGEGVSFREYPPQLLQNCIISLDRKGRNKDKASWQEGTIENHTKGYQPKRATVYNLEVEDYHTYFVGEHGIWVR